MSVDSFQIEIRPGTWAPVNREQLRAYMERAHPHLEVRVNNRDFGRTVEIKPRKLDWWLAELDDIAAARRCFERRWKIVDDRGRDTFMRQSDIDPAGRYRLEYIDNGDRFTLSLYGHEVPAFLAKLQARWEIEAEAEKAAEDQRRRHAALMEAWAQGPEIRQKARREAKLWTWGALIGTAVFLWTAGLIWGWWA